MSQMKPGDFTATMDSLRQEFQWMDELGKELLLQEAPLTFDEWTKLFGVVSRIFEVLPQYGQNLRWWEETIERGCREVLRMVQDVSDEDIHEEAGELSAWSYWRTCSVSARWFERLMPLMQDVKQHAAYYRACRIIDTFVAARIAFLQKEKALAGTEWRLEEVDKNLPTELVTWRHRSDPATAAAAVQQLYKQLQ